jgi:hypothetical protein
MSISRPLVQATLILLGLIFLMPGCVAEPREGYFDRDHHRWYHNHVWQACGENDEHCR